MKVRMSTKGRIVLPVEIRREDHVEPGQEFEIERINNGEYRLRRTGRFRNEGFVEALLACPVKDWFKPMDRSVTIDDIDPPKFE